MNLDPKNRPKGKSPWMNSQISIKEFINDFEPLKDGDTVTIVLDCNQNFVEFWMRNGKLYTIILQNTSNTW